MYRLELLGPVTLRRDGRVLPLATQKGQALLLLLALQGPAHRARIAGWLWPSVDDASARRNLRRELARLREGGVGDLLHSEGEVLSLAAAPLLACDAWAFREGARSEAEPERDAALALWRGLPAEGLALEGAEAFEDWLQRERESLRQLHQRALHAAAAVCEARNDREGALECVQALLADDPLQEQLHREAMRLLLATGRREAALAQYRRCSELLRRELGLAPMAATLALASEAASDPVTGPAPSLDPTPGPAPGTTAGRSPHLARSSDDRGFPAVGAPTGQAVGVRAAAAASPPRESPGNDALWPGDLPLTGRDAAWSALQGAWQARRTVLIEGEAGSGKTRLASDFVASQGAYALAQCRAGDADTPYAAFKRALRLLAGPVLPADALPPWVSAELAHVLPELGPAAPRTATAEDRSRLHEAAIAAWHALAAGSFDAVLIDDWHLADADSRRLLAAIAHAGDDDAGAPAERPRLFFLLRPELDPVGRTLAQQLVQRGAAHLVLTPLDCDELLTLVRRLTGAADPHRFSQRLGQATGGNPFFVAETLRHWQALGLLARGGDGVWRTPFDDATHDYRELPLPASVREAVQARVARQPAAVQRLLEAAALAAEPFSPALLAGACALSELEALDAIDTALAAGLLRELGGGYAFAHDLVQWTLEQSLAPDRCRLVHRRLALGAQGAGLGPAEIARHWETGGEPQRAVAHRLAAAEAALALASWETAELHWQAAVADGPSPVEHLRLLRQRWPTMQVRDERAGLQATLDELEALAAQWAQHPDTAHAALAARTEQALLLSLGLDLKTPHTALALTETVLPALADDDPLWPRLQLARAQALNSAGRAVEAERAVEDALSRPGPALTPRMQAQLLHTLAYSHFSRGRPERALPFAQRTLAVWQAAGERRLMVRALANVGLMHSAIGELAPSVAVMRQARAIAAELRMIEVHRELCNNIADVMLVWGEAEQAVALADEALGLSPNWAQPAFRVYLHGMKVQALWQRGDLGAALGQAESALAMALEDAGVNPLADCVSMALDVYAFIGDWAGADALLAPLQARMAEVIPHFAVKLAFNRVRLALQRGDIDAARQALAAVGPVPELHERRDQEHAVLCQAEFALATGDADAAGRWLADWPAPEAHVEVAARRALAALQAWRVLDARPPGVAAPVAAAAGVAWAATAPADTPTGVATDSTAAAPIASLAAAIEQAAAQAENPRAPLPTRLELARALADLPTPVSTPVSTPADPAGAAGAAAWQARAAQACETIARSLRDRPVQHAAFLHRWG